ncbi:hypothetical protein KR009_003569 [Drosophila setifemur]|nr:hypothetical protein KR009_003569 [Drosophila setifemur]
MHPRDRIVGPAINGRITNGKNAAVDQFPYQVGLSFSGSGGSWWCGGSIIANTWLLTAAHCTEDSSSVTVYYGSTVRTSPKLTHTVSSSNFIQHASYNSKTLNNDISLIKTPSVTFSSGINRIALPSIATSYSTYSGQTAVASGWGRTSDSATSVASNLQYADLRVITNSVCQQTYGTSVITSGVICVSSVNEVSTCKGDSGGPLALDSRLIGVTSFVSSKGCEKNAPSGFTRVTSYLDWIKSNSATVRTSPQFTHTVSSSDFIQHASYLSLTVRNDIALIKTPSVGFSATINKIALPTIQSSYSSYVGKTAVASGWGLTSDSAEAVAKHLQYADLTVIDNDICQKTFTRLIVTSKVLCVASTNAISTCSGDSGGPLALNDILIGITSFGSADGCEIGEPAAFTRVTSYLDWIKENSGVFA